MLFRADNPENADEPVDLKDQDEYDTAIREIAEYCDWGTEEYCDALSYDPARVVERLNLPTGDDDD